MGGFGSTGSHFAGAVAAVQSVGSQLVAGGAAAAGSAAIDYGASAGGCVAIRRYGS